MSWIWVYRRKAAKYLSFFAEGLPHTTMRQLTPLLATHDSSEQAPLASTSATTQRTPSRVPRPKFTELPFLAVRGAV